MNTQLVVGIAIPIVAGGLYLRDRHLKAKVRGCRCCGRTNVKRTFKMYPIVGTPSVAGVLHSLIVGPPLVTQIMIEDGRAPFTVYKFSECLHCGHFAMVESYDKRFTLSSLRHKVHREPEAFVHDASLFRQANLTPCTTLNLQFDPKVLGGATLEERHFGFRLPWRVDKPITSKCA
ncbi:MAG: hypothetical protein RLZZ347_370 [Candidatus Parcubacteria bacterium]|jgi:hypothetical protein